MVPANFAMIIPPTARQARSPNGATAREQVARQRIDADREALMRRAREADRQHRGSHTGRLRGQRDRLSEQRAGKHRGLARTARLPAAQQHPRRQRPAAVEHNLRIVEAVLPALCARADTVRIWRLDDTVGLERVKARVVSP